jgi:Ca2+/Na+ antiporter
MAGAFDANFSFIAEGAAVLAGLLCWIDAFLIHANKAIRAEIATVLTRVGILLAFAIDAHVPVFGAVGAAVFAGHIRWVFAYFVHTKEARRAVVATILARVRVRQLADAFLADFDCCTVVVVNTVGGPL